MTSPPPAKSRRARGGRLLKELFDLSGDNALPFTPGADDVRIERDEWVYYVRAVHRGQSLKQDFSPIDLTGLVLYLLFSGFVDDWRARRPWKVGVLRRRNRGFWRLHVLHKEVLPAGVPPDVRRMELAARVRSGGFDNSA